MVPRSIAGTGHHSAYINVQITSAVFNAVAVMSLQVEDAAKPAIDSKASCCRYVHIQGRRVAIKMMAFDIIPAGGAAV